ncbi:hypothetical protein CANARDRAFT_6192 [[Candida] arabinofermentans NRRL YB-2248]|uniref:PCI domain-containing protein n=1 Tax=[Candida] arabinofermentans NRRL YB-2248 TaxID=983967 RepID=A0A1E4T4L5_9ASCO|nr:hypothetical protein CANARDRAFT_6192 [[Candida] arabinofermentans NRRL YB-2248]
MGSYERHFGHTDVCTAVDRITLDCNELKASEILNILTEILSDSTPKATRESIYGFVLAYCKACETVDECQPLVEMLQQIGEISLVYQSVVFLRIADLSMDLNEDDARKYLSKVNQLKISEFPLQKAQYHLLHARSCSDSNVAEKSLTKAHEIVSSLKQEHQSGTSLLSFKENYLDLLTFNIRYHSGQLFYKWHKFSLSLPHTFATYILSSPRFSQRSIDINYLTLLQLLIITPYTSTKVVYIHKFIDDYRKYGSRCDSNISVSPIIDAISAMSDGSVYSMSGGCSKLISALNSLCQAHQEYNQLFLEVMKDIIIKNMADMNIVAISKVFENVKLDTIVHLLGLTNDPELNSELILDIIIDLILEKKIDATIDEVDSIIYFLKDAKAGDFNSLVGDALRSIDKVSGDLNTYINVE